jgi:hypothetical protein
LTITINEVGVDSELTHKRFRLSRELMNVGI